MIYLENQDAVKERTKKPGIKMFGVEWRWSLKRNEIESDTPEPKFSWKIWIPFLKATWPMSCAMFCVISQVTAFIFGHIHVASAYEQHILFKRSLLLSDNRESRWTRTEKYLNHFIHPRRRTCQKYRSKQSKRSVGTRPMMQWTWSPTLMLRFLIPITRSAPTFSAVVKWRHLRFSAVGW